jgi:hypothetical protein
MDLLLEGCTKLSIQRLSLIAMGKNFNKRCFGTQERPSQGVLKTVRFKEHLENGADLV